MGKIFRGKQFYVCHKVSTMHGNTIKTTDATRATARFSLMVTKLSKL